jgi:hypothetical protein
MDQAELCMIVKSSHGSDVVGKQKVEQILRRPDGAVLIIWKPRKWVLTDFVLKRRFGSDWVNNKI